MRMFTLVFPAPPWNMLTLALPCHLGLSRRRRPGGQDLRQAPCLESEAARRQQL